MLLDKRARNGILDGDFTLLTEDIINAPISDRLSLPKVTLFDGTGTLLTTWESIPCGHELMATLMSLSVGFLIRPCREKLEGGGINYQPTPSRVSRI